MKKNKVHNAPVYVAASKIHGKGLFASRDIKKGELLGKFTYKSTKKEGPYVLWLEQDKGCQVQGDLKYINHADKANAAYYDDFTVMAIKKIKKNEEITHYYGQDWND